MSKKTLKVRNALTGAVREVQLPGKPAAKKKPAKKAPAAVKKPVEPKAEGDDGGQSNG